MTDPVTDRESWIDEHLGGPRERFAEFARKVYGQGDLERRQKELIAVAAASALRAPDTTESHMDAAAEEGATRAQIAEALSVPWVQGGGTQIAWMAGEYAEVLGQEWRQDLIGDADREFWAFKREVYEDGALPEKTKHLISVAASSARRCPHCTRGHMESALDAGASRKEIAEALAVLWLVGSEVEVDWSRELFQERLGTPVSA